MLQLTGFKQLFVATNKNEPPTSISSTMNMNNWPHAIAAAATTTTTTSNLCYKNRDVAKPS